VMTGGKFVFRFGRSLPRNLTNAAARKAVAAFADSTLTGRSTGNSNRFAVPRRDAASSD